MPIIGVLVDPTALPGAILQTLLLLSSLVPLSLNLSTHMRLTILSPMTFNGVNRFQWLGLYGEGLLPKRLNLFC